MKTKTHVKTLVKTGILIWMLVFQFLIPSFGQQVQWAQVYPMSSADYINCVAKDDNFIYAGGRTFRNATLNSYYKAILIKLDLNGDTVFVRDIGIHGSIKSMTIDYSGNLRLNVEQYFFGPPSAYKNFLIQMTPEGFVFKTDTIPRYALNACTMGKDSSLIIVGSKRRLGGSTSETSMYFWRMDKNGMLDSWIELNPGHPNCVANKVEQLPNGHYLISGYVGSRVASYEVDSVGGNPVFHQWYQSANTTNMSTGYVGRLGQKNWMMAGSGAPDIIAAYDSSQNKIWMRQEQGVQQPPQAMRDTSIVFGYSLAVWPFQYFTRLRLDSSQVWFFNMRDSLNARGILGSLNINSYAYYDDESAIFAGEISQDDGIPPDTDNDPFFMRVANVGTPVTALTKPKRGTLSNETLAPWPNPSGGTLYLKQHFDKAEVHFYTVSGREVQTDTVRFGQPIDISSFATGLYMYRAVIDGKPFSGKVVKN
jgi:hypothetical protein